jgi:hypothetical protein
MEHNRADDHVQRILRVQQAITDELKKEREAEMETNPSPARVVVDVLSSWYFGPDVVVLVTACGHRHVRPRSRITSVVYCPFCADDPQRKADHDQ